MEWNGMEWNGMEWNGMEWNGMEWNGMEWNGMEWNHQLRKELQFRKLKKINLEAFKDDIAASDLCRLQSSTLEDLVKCYDDTLSSILDKHAPLQRKVVVVRPMVPWFSDDLKKLKSRRRKLEKKMLKS
ncbi:hypothetical protein QZH41_005129 [Actinostola sp. cb2023]|nr:hypothetical protein QZH41_005129 [Actinostola sp. cb2023]